MGRRGERALGSQLRPAPWFCHPALVWLTWWWWWWWRIIYGDDLYEDGEGGADHKDCVKDDEEVFFDDWGNHFMIFRIFSSWWWLWWWWKKRRRRMTRLMRMMFGRRRERRGSPSLVRGMRRSPCLAGAEGAPPVDCTPWTQLGYHWSQTHFLTQIQCQHTQRHQ